MAEEGHNQQMLIQPQPSPQQQQQPQQQTVAATMSLGNNVTMEQANQMNVSNSLPMNVTAINVSQAQSMPNIAATANTTSGAPVQLAVPQLTAQSQAPQPGTMMSQSSGPHPTMIHPTMTMAQSPLQQVQVIQQPLSTSYLQHLYTPQQQMLFPGNLTLQHAGMAGPTLQSLGPTQGLSLQLQAKATLDSKTSVGGQALQAVNAANKGMAVNTGAMMTASGQVIGTAGAKASFQQQMMAGPGKSTIIHSQQGFAPSNTNQTVVIGQLGVLPNQQSIFNHKALADSQKGKTYMMNQPATLQPKSPIYSSSLPVHSSAQVFNGNHLKQLTTQPQLITSQAPGTMFSQAQILGSLALGASLPQGISWATPGCLQPSALLAQNPIIIRSQQSDMYIQSPPQAAVHLPVAASAPVPPTSFASTPLAPQKMKQVRVRPGSSVATQTVVSSTATVNSNAPPIRTQIKPKVRTAGSPMIVPGMVPVSPQMATTQTQTNQSHVPPPMAPQQIVPQIQPQLQQKTDAANQTKPTPEMKSIATQSKSVAVEAKQLPPVAKTQAMIAPSAKIQTSVSPVAISISTSTAPTHSTISTSTNTFPEVTIATVAPTVNSISSSTSTFSDVAINSKPEMKKEHLSERKDCQVPTQSTEPRKEVKGTGTETAKPELMVKPALSVVKDKQPQKAIVKPQVLTHVIDGYIIQEGPEPFPVSRSSLMTDIMSSKSVPSETPEKTQETNGVGTPEKKKKIHRARGNVELAKCEFCGKMGPKSKFKRSKRFCSTSCAKRYNVCCSKRVGLLPAAMQENVIAPGKGNKRKMGFKTRKGWRKQEGGRLAYNTSDYNEEENQDDSAIQMEEEEDNIQDEESTHLGKTEEEATESPSGSESPINALPLPKDDVMEVEKSENVLVTKLPNKWSVQEVFEFIRDLPGCSDYADEFRSQEIDGQALLLLKEDHLMTAMCMKLGPALKLIARINSIKEELSIS